MINNIIAIFSLIFAAISGIFYAKHKIKKNIKNENCYYDLQKIYEIKNDEANHASDDINIRRERLRKYATDK